MSNNPQENPTGTLGLTGLTVNAMALIAPGAFLWLTFEEQSLYGAPMAGCAMWFGILTALALCYATAISYSELSKIYPGAGSSYLYTEQAFLSKTKAVKFSRIAKFIVGWASHLYYWVYPGVMVGVTAIFCGYMANQFWPTVFSPAYNSPLFMIIVCVVFSLLVGWIASRGVSGSTGVNTAVNIIQITALIIFTCMAISYRLKHNQGDVAWHLSNGAAVTYQVQQTNQLDSNNKPIQAKWADGTPQVDSSGKPVYATQDQQVADSDNKDATFAKLGLSTGDPYPVLQTDAKGKLVLDKNGVPIEVPFTISYLPTDAYSGGGAPHSAADGPLTFNFHPNALSVIAPHSINYLIVQACIAILLIVGFESVTAMGEEAKNPKKDIGRAVILSLTIQAGFCYMFEYFGANFFMNNGYTIGNAGASAAPIGDMMTLVGAWMFGSAKAGTYFMWTEALTVFLALIGTTLACINTGARVTYAMGKDKEVGELFGDLHAKSGAPTKGIWILTFISIFLGIVTVVMYLGGASPSPLDPSYVHSVWYSFGIFPAASYTTAWNSLLIMTLISNFGTFLLYGMTCLTAIIAFKEHHAFHGFKHVVVPVFGLCANLGCMMFYIIGPFSVAGMSWHEPFVALAVVAIWGIWGAIHFITHSKKKEKPIFVSSPAAA
jgi:APA family basic amino acid/polyamine antiporter